MSQAHALYELYTHLPEKEKKRFIQLIQEGKLPRRTFADLKREIANEK